jgi:O-antigen/teichoic acid export membrane protein
MTAEIRSQERGKKILKTAWSGMIARVISIVSALLMIPLTVSYLGHEQYGIWVAVSSLIIMLGFMDGGAGNAVINMVAYSCGSQNSDLPKIISTAIFSLAAVACVGILLFFAVFPFVPWGKLFGVNNAHSIHDLEWVIITTTLFFFIGIVTTLIAKIQRGFQEGNFDNFWSSIGVLLNLLFVYLAIKTQGTLPMLVMASLSGTLLAYLASNVHYFGWHRTDLIPKLSQFDRTKAQELFSVGGLFFVLQIASGIQAQSDNILISNLLGPAAVTSYAVCMKLFMMVPTLSGFLFTPLWPAYREAIANGDMQWVRKIFIKSLRLALLISIPSAFILMLFGDTIIEYWVGPNAIPSTSLLVGCGLWLIILTIITALAVFLNGLNMIKVQLIFVLCAATANVLCSIWLIQKMGAVGAVWGSVIANIFFILVPFFFIVKKVLSNMDIPPFDASAGVTLI